MKPNINFSFTITYDSRGEGKGQAYYWSLSHLEPAGYAADRHAAVDAAFAAYLEHLREQRDRTRQQADAQQAGVEAIADILRPEGKA